jgi:methylated-DNA-[protein]-cysteine S-methyltransferase
MKFKSRRLHPHIDSPLGTMLLAATDRGLAGVWFDQGQRHGPTPPAGARTTHPVLVEAAPAARLLRRPAHTFDCRSTCRHGTAVPAKRVAGAAGDSRRRHHQLRRAGAPLGRPQAARGGRGGRPQPGQHRRALPPRARHRGSLTGYAGGLDRKTALLQLEGALSNASKEKCDDEDA